MRTILTLRQKDFWQKRHNSVIVKNVSWKNIRAVDEVLKCLIRFLCVNILVRLYVHLKK